MPKARYVFYWKQRTLTGAGDFEKVTKKDLSAWIAKQIKDTGAEATVNNVIEYILVTHDAEIGNKIIRWEVNE